MPKRSNDKPEPAPKRAGCSLPSGECQGALHQFTERSLDHQNTNVDRLEPEVMTLCETHSKCATCGETVPDHEFHLVHDSDVACARVEKSERDVTLACSFWCSMCDQACLAETRDNVFYANDELVCNCCSGQCIGCSECPSASSSDANSDAESS